MLTAAAVCLFALCCVWLFVWSPFLLVSFSKVELEIKPNDVFLGTVRKDYQFVKLNYNKLEVKKTTKTKQLRSMSCESVFFLFNYTYWNIFYYEQAEQVKKMFFFSFLIFIAMTTVSFSLFYSYFLLFVLFTYTHTLYIWCFSVYRSTNTLTCYREGSLMECAPLWPFTVLNQSAEGWSWKCTFFLLFFLHPGLIWQSSSAHSTTLAFLSAV